MPLIKPKLKTCSICQKPSILFQSKPATCYNCARKHFKPIQASKTTKPIQKVSDKQSKLLREYSRLREQYLRQHPICQAKVKCKGRIASDLHHQKGRGKYLCDTTFFLSTCRECHDWITEHSKEAIELGLSVSRLQP